MGRHRISPDTSKGLDELVSRAAKLFKVPYDDRETRRDDAPSVSDVADEMKMSRSTVRKLLITGGVYSTYVSRRVKEMTDEGMSDNEIMDKLRLGRAALASWRPYSKVPYNLNEPSRNARNCKKYHYKKKLKRALQDAIADADTSDNPGVIDIPASLSLVLWNTVISFEDHCFITAGRKNAAADGGDQEERLRRIKFTYTVSRNPGKGGRHFEGPDVDGYGNELWIMKNGGEQKEKSISRSTVECGLRNALRIMKNQGYVKGPKALGIPGAGSYLYAIFLNWGIIKDSEEEA